MYTWHSSTARMQMYFLVFGIGGTFGRNGSTIGLLRVMNLLISSNSSVTSFPQKKVKKASNTKVLLQERLWISIPKKKSLSLRSPFEARRGPWSLEMRFHRMERGIATLEENRKHNGDFSSNCQLSVGNPTYITAISYQKEASPRGKKVSRMKVLS